MHAGQIASDKFQLPRVTVERGRFAAIQRATVGKSVLHVGCADAGMQDARLDEGQLLHERLALLAINLVGVDIDADAVEALRRRGVTDIFVADVCSSGWSNAFAEREFDLVVVSEVLEHVANAGLFLSNLRAFAHGKRAHALFTVPSAFSVAVLQSLLRNTEFVHPDHNYWFSFQTVMTLLEKNGWQVDTVSTYSFEDTRIVAPVLTAFRGKANPWVGLKWASRAALRSPRRMVARWLEHRSPFFSDGLIISAQPRPPE